MDIKKVKNDISEKKMTFGSSDPDSQCFYNGNYGPVRIDWLAIDS